MRSGIMTKQYKFILTLPNEVVIDSAEEIHNHMSWPNWSQADPVRYRGIFDSYEVAKEYASKFKIYKYILLHFPQTQLYFTSIYNNLSYLKNTN
jgi:hypothetical protein